MNLRYYTIDLEALFDEYMSVMNMLINMGVWGNRDNDYAGSTFEAVDYLTDEMIKSLKQIQEHINGRQTK